MSQNVAKSVDINEVEKFSKIAAEWWDINGKFKPLHKFNPVRLEYIIQNIKNKFAYKLQSPDGLHPLKNIRILDIGCGGGLLSVPLARLGASVTSIDASANNIKTLQAKINEVQQQENSKLDITTLATSAEELLASMNTTENKSTYDIVLNMEVIEHVADEHSFMQASSQLMANDGLMFLATLNRTLKSLLTAKIGAEYILNWLPKGTHDWQKFFKPSELAKLLEANHCKIDEIKGVSYNIFKDEFYLSQDVSVNYMIMASK